MKQSLQRRGLGGLILTVSLLGARPALAIGALGDLDSDFNQFSTPGFNITHVGTSTDTAFAVAVQADGKIVLAGETTNGGGSDFAVVRYKTDGTLDTGFNGTGMATIDFGPNFARATGVVVQPDGRIVVAGFAYVDGATFTDFALARFNSDGTLDSGFGTGGKVTTDFGATSDYPGGIALQVDGKIVVAGEHNDPGGGFDYALARYNSDGSLDTTFGSNGRVTTALGATNDSPVTLTVQPDGRIVIASGYDATATNSDFLVARYTATGALDTTFNPGGSLGGGVVTTDLGASFESARAVAVQPDGKIVAAGVSGSPAAMALVRYNADGSPDTAFGASGDGTLIYPLGSSSAAAYGVALQPNGKIVVAGASSNGADNDFTLVRFTADGSADGARIDPVGSANDSAFALAVEPDGRLIAAGAGNDGTATGFAVARYISNDAPWDVTPNIFTFADVLAAAHNSVQTSNIITIAGLDTDTYAAVRVSGGTYARNGATTYTSDPGWVRNGDTLSVRHTAAASSAETVDTVLTVGGLSPGDNPALVLGGTVSDTFSSTTGNGPSGGGLLGPWSLTLLLAAWRRRRLARS